MRSRGFFVTAILVLASLFVCSLTVGAADPDTLAAPVGEVLYHQDFSVLSSYAKSGWKTGTASAEGADIRCADGALTVWPSGTGRVYTILPDVERGSTYTVEFTFRFLGEERENGSLSYLLTCRGEEPTNITSLVIRSDGSVDRFEAPDERIADAIRAGEAVTAAIPVENGAVHSLSLSAGDVTSVLERSSVQVIGGGSVGFSFRNAGAAISEVWIVSGSGYEEKTGDFASYASDVEEAETIPEEPGEEPATDPADGTEEPDPKPETAPETQDSVGFWGAIMILSGSAAAVLAGGNTRRKRRGI